MIASQFSFVKRAHTTINGNRNGLALNEEEEKNQQRHNSESTYTVNEDGRWALSHSKLCMFCEFRLLTSLNFHCRWCVCFFNDRKTFTVQIRNRGVPDMYWQIYYKIWQRFAKRFGCVVWAGWFVGWLAGWLFIQFQAKVTARDLDTMDTKKNSGLMHLWYQYIRSFTLIRVIETKRRLHFVLMRMF